jgi:multidrug/hemolysin transport system permease protein
MKDILTLTKRHIKNYLRDKSTVFFSFLSVIILLAIYLLFLGKQYPTLEGLTNFQQTYFKWGFIMGGVIVVNTINLSLGVIGLYVTDLEQKKLDGFFVSPIKRYKITLSYYLATTLVTLVFTLLMLFFIILYLGISTGVFYSFSSIVTLIGVVTLFVFISSSIMIFLASFLKSANALGAASAIIGTVIGFIAGIYIPLYLLDSFTKNLAAVLPFSHMTLFLRRLLIGSDLLNTIDANIIEGFALDRITLFGVDVPALIALIASSLIAVAVLILSYFKINKKEK